MKIRNGFVSNSSSSSFCIYGVAIEKDFLEIFRAIKKNDPKSFKKTRDWVKKDWDDSKDILDWMDNIDGDGADDVPDAIYENMDVTELLEDSFKDMSINAPCDGETIYIGRSWSDIGDNETGGEFKKSVREAISKIFDKVKFNTHEEAWRDG